MADIRRTVLLLATTLALVVGACTASTETATTTVPAAKTTCPELVPSTPLDGYRIVERHLIPYTRTILGVEATYEAGEERTVMLYSGGYLDDITETYDDLQPSGTTDLAGFEAGLLAGSFLEEPVSVAYVLGSQPPCGTLAVVGVGMPTAELDAIARSLTLRVRE